jgi:hypothetical protein
MQQLYFQLNCTNCLRIVTPTGNAAPNIHWCTIYFLLSFMNDSISWERLHSLQIELIIDEYSFLSVATIDSLDTKLFFAAVDVAKWIACIYSTVLFFLNYEYLSVSIQLICHCRSDPSAWLCRPPSRYLSLCCQQCPLFSCSCHIRALHHSFIFLFFSFLACVSTAPSR